jgi:hypothetical protein
MAYCHSESWEGEKVPVSTTAKFMIFITMYLFHIHNRHGSSAAQTYIQFTVNEDSDGPDRLTW